MSAETPPDPPAKRKPYEKPELSEVALRPEEAVLGNCKTMGVSGPAEADCTSLGGCMTFGS
jgi:hypothetical protein